MEVQFPLVFFTLLAGTGGGTMIFMCIYDLLGFKRRVARITCYVIAGFLAVGGLCSVFHLAQKAHIMSAVTNIGSFSGISMELIGLSVCFVLIVLYWLFCREGQSEVVRRVLAVLCGIGGLAFCWIQGDSYVIAARPHWDTYLLPLGYWASGIAIGGVVFTTVLVVLKEEDDSVKRVCTFAIGAVVLQLVCYLAFGIATGTDALVENGLVFWGLEIVLGSLVPLACLVAIRLGKDKRLVYVALACAFAGGIAYRAMMWILGTPAVVDLFDTARTQRGYIEG